MGSQSFLIPPLSHVEDLVSRQRSVGGSPSSQPENPSLPLCGSTAGTKTVIICSLRAKLLLLQLQCQSTACHRPTCEVQLKHCLGCFSRQEDDLRVGNTSLGKWGAVLEFLEQRPDAGRIRHAPKQLAAFILSCEQQRKRENGNSPG